jgi:hypothetical protein
MNQLPTEVLLERCLSLLADINGTVLGPDEAIDNICVANLRQRSLAMQGQLYTAVNGQKASISNYNHINA